MEGQLFHPSHRDHGKIQFCIYKFTSAFFVFHLIFFLFAVYFIILLFIYLFLLGNIEEQCSFPGCQVLVFQSTSGLAPSSSCCFSLVHVGIEPATLVLRAPALTDWAIRLPQFSSFLMDLIQVGFWILLWTDCDFLLVLSLMSLIKSLTHVHF